MNELEGALGTSALRELVLVTGISGSGKSVALHALEDAAFFCVDNLPPELLRGFLQLENERLDRRVAIAVDVRSAGSLPHLLPLLQQLRGAQLAGVDHGRDFAQLGQKFAFEFDRIDERVARVGRAVCAARGRGVVRQLGRQRVRPPRF